MAITVEDGTGILLANALVTLAEADAHFADFGGAWAGDDADKTAAIVRASLWLSSFPDWDGSMTYGRGLQGLALPRSGMTDCNGDAISPTEVPIEAKQATYIAAQAELKTPGILTPTAIPSTQVKSTKVDVIEIEYMTPKDQGVVDGRYDASAAQRPTLTQVEDLLKCMASFGRSLASYPFVA